MSQRIATIDRKTNETSIRLELNLDGRGLTDAQTGVGFLDHMLDHLGKHSTTDLKVRCDGDTHVDDHHTVEDVGICIGQAIAEALGDKRGIRRYGSASVPMDETLANVALDLSGRAAFVFNAGFATGKIGQFDTQLVEEFLRAVANAARMNLHVNVPYGTNDHHMAEAIFKAVAQALRIAKSIDPDRAGDVPSTKGSL
ncbi:MAG: imidazoleglycerol-phosphate dehydratase HisB [Phycisphaerae bacterium]